MGNGKQIMSWIHIDDLCRLFVFAIENQNLKGVFNAVSPEPVSNLNFIKKLAAITYKKQRGKRQVLINVVAGRKLN